MKTMSPPASTRLPWALSALDSLVLRLLELPMLKLMARPPLASPWAWAVAAALMHWRICSPAVAAPRAFMRALSVWLMASAVCTALHGLHLSAANCCRTSIHLRSDAKPHGVRNILFRRVAVLSLEKS